MQDKVVRADVDPRAQGLGAGSVVLCLIRRCRVEGLGEKLLRRGFGEKVLKWSERWVKFRILDVIPSASCFGVGQPPASPAPLLNTSCRKEA